VSNRDLWIWLFPALFALLSYGVGQGLVKKWVGDVSPARFCFYFLLAKSVVNLGYFFLQDHPPLLEEGVSPFLMSGVFAYILDGLGWVLYFESILLGPITMVGTLSAAYPALTVLLASRFLGESLELAQYIGVILVIAGCMGLAVDFSAADAQVTTTRKPLGRRWIPLAGSALILWACAQTLVKYAYTLPSANDASLAVCSTMGGALTLGLYALWKEKASLFSGMNQIPTLVRSILPMGLMAGGDLGVIIANQFGPVSLVTPITGAYPVITLLFAAFVLRESVHWAHWAMVILILVGMAFATWTPS
jgi:drug/metabolite transporter (DMT)-like permease